MTGNSSSKHLFVTYERSRPLRKCIVYLYPPLHFLWSSSNAPGLSPSSAGGACGVGGWAVSPGDGDSEGAGGAGGASGGGGMAPGPAAKTLPILLSKCIAR